MEKVKKVLKIILKLIPVLLEILGELGKDANEGIDALFGGKSGFKEYGVDNDQTPKHSC